MSDNFTIFMADDDEDDRLLFKEALSESPEKTLLHLAEDGDMLMQLLFGLKVKPDLILLDINMPKKTGLECLNEIRAEKRFAHVPVIIYSTSVDIRYVNSAHDSGASYYLKKPDSFTGLRKVVDFCLKVKHNDNMLKMDFVVDLNKGFAVA